jgi:predicted metal-binding membrane protein
MIALFVVGSMSLLWMGAVSVVIFGEKVGFKKLAFSRGIGALLILLGGGVVAQSLLIP